MKSLNKNIERRQVLSVPLLTGELKAWVRATSKRKGRDEEKRRQKEEAKRISNQVGKMVESVAKVLDQKKILGQHDTADRAKAQIMANEDEHPKKRFAT